MSFASSSARTIRARTIPIATASALSVSIYAVYTTWQNPLLAEDLTQETVASISKTKSKFALPATASPYTPLGWGNNRNLTLSADQQIANLKKPAPLTFIGATPLRDLVVAERYGACIDARGDCWMWGTGYDPSGQVGRSLKGKKLKELAPARSKLIALSRDGKLYAIAASKALQAQRNDRNEQSWLSYIFGTNPGVDFYELKAQGGLKRGEKWAGVSVGTNHLLAVTSTGRSFSLPLSAQANSHRHLGTRQEFLPQSSEILPEADPRFCPTLTEIPSLAGIQIAQVATSDRSSFVRTSTGRVLGFGANEVGQIGLGSNAAVEIVQVPVEIVLAKGYPGGTTLSCLDIKAGGSTTFFTVERSAPGKAGSFIDLLACGSGISGSLGNGLWSSANGTPSRVKTVSGLQEYSEKVHDFIPLGISSLSVSPSPSAHIFAVLDSAKEADEKGLGQGLYGKDVMVWGGNVDYQLGNGKRSSLAVPQHLPPLVQRLVDPTGAVAAEAGLSSGTLSPMPHSRLQLHQGNAHAYDLNGKLIKRNVACEETVVAGWNASVLYNKIKD